MLKQILYHHYVRQEQIIIFIWQENDLKSKNFNYVLERVNLCIIIGDINQFIGHCVIPLDPW